MGFNHAKAKELVEGHETKRPVIARKCGIEPHTLTKYLNGHGDPGLPVIKHLAQILGVPESELVDEGGPEAA